MPRRDHGDIEVLALANRSASHWPDASGARSAVTIRYHRYHIKSAQRLVSCQLAAQHTSDRQEQCRSDCAAVFSVQLSCKAVREAALDRAEARHVDVSTIPVIDIADIARDSRSERAIGAEMLSAAEGIGFFYIRNTAVPQTLIDRVLDISRRFFAAAPDAKASVTVNAGHRGFIRVGEAKMTENAQPDLKESFIWGLYTLGEDGIPPNRWPDFLP